MKTTHDATPSMTITMFIQPTQTMSGGDFRPNRRKKQQHTHTLKQKQSKTKTTQIAFQ